MIVPTLLEKRIYRVIENQIYNSTRQLVDTDEEQHILEDLIDSSKPDYMEGTKQLNYLLKTPFRYPPLDYGSRFGNKNEHGIFYGSFELATAFCEAAYFRFRFLLDTTKELIDKYFDYTSFYTEIKTYKALNLTDTIWKNYWHEISNPASYRYSQEIGREARNVEMEVIIYFSARAKGQKNAAILSQKALKNKNVKATQIIHWQCYADKSQVSFRNRWQKKQYHFSLEEFIINGQFPIATD